MALACGGAAAGTMSMPTVLCIMALLVIEVFSRVPHCQTDDDCGVAEYCGEAKQCRCLRGHLRLSVGGCRSQPLECHSSSQCRELGHHFSCVDGKCVIKPAAQRQPPEPVPLEPPPSVLRNANPAIWNKRSRVSSFSSTANSTTMTMTTTKVRQQPTPATTLAGPISVGLLVFFSFAILLVTMAYRCSFRFRQMERLERTESPLQVLRSTSRTPSLPSYNSLNPPSYEEATARGYGDTADYQRLQALREEAPSPPLKDANYSDHEKDTPPTYSEMPAKLSSVSVVDLREESTYFPALPTQLLWDEQDPGDFLKTYTDEEEHKTSLAIEKKSEGSYATKDFDHSEHEKDEPPTYTELPSKFSSVSVVDLWEESTNIPPAPPMLHQDGPGDFFRPTMDTEDHRVPMTTEKSENSFAMRRLLTSDAEAVGDADRRQSSNGGNSCSDNDVSIHL